MVHASIDLPAAAYSLPSPVLGTQGGGRMFLDPRDPTGARTLQAVFQFELTIPDADPEQVVGRRAWVRFGLGSEPLPARWYRSLRQLFLRNFSV